MQMLGHPAVMLCSNLDFFFFLDTSILIFSSFMIENINFRGDLASVLAKTTTLAYRVYVWAGQLVSV